MELSHMDVECIWIFQNAGVEPVAWVFWLASSLPVGTQPVGKTHVINFTHRLYNFDCSSLWRPSPHPHPTPHKLDVTLEIFEGPVKLSSIHLEIDGDPWRLEVNTEEVSILRTHVVVAFTHILMSFCICYVRLIDSSG